jgi:hypothetical protein
MVHFVVVHVVFAPAPIMYMGSMDTLEPGELGFITTMMLDNIVAYVLHVSSFNNA